jgi:hypothetical protein
MTSPVGHSPFAADGPLIWVLRGRATSGKRPRCPVPDAGARVWVDAVDENLQCCVCQELFTDPVALPSCGHSFCRGCAMIWFTSPARRCPTCRCESSLYFNRVTQLASNYALKSLADSVRLNRNCHCRFGVRAGPRGDWEPDPEGCPWTGPASAADVHEAGCVHKPVPCRWGCGLELLPREAGTHEAECADSLVRCRFFGCNVQHKRRDTSEHEKEAAQRHARCEREKRLQLQSLGEHDEFTRAAAAAISRAKAAKDIGLVVAALRFSYRCARVSDQACIALKALCKNEADQQIAVDAGAIDAVLAAMRAHCHRHGDVSFQACGALYALWRNKSYQQIAGDAGAIDAVLVAMRAHPGNEIVQDAACWALWSMTSNHEENAAKAGTAGASEIVVAAMQAHPGNAPVQVSACAALVGFTGVASNLVNARAAGAVEAVLAAMQAQPGNSHVQRYGRQVLRLMNADDAGQ